MCITDDIVIQKHGGHVTVYISESNGNIMIFKHSRTGETVNVVGSASKCEFDSYPKCTTQQTCLSVGVLAVFSR